MEGITVGRRTKQDTTWPTFLFSSPKSIVREFLGGLFGGDGHAPYLSKTTIFGVKFSQSIIEDKKDNFELIKSDQILTYKYKSKYPHAGAGVRVQF